jgi:dienelactone hydrolase
VAFERTETSFPSGGDECAATLYFPAEPAEDDIPAVVLAQGFTGTREDGIPRFAERFAEAGIAALTLDYRGFGDSGGDERFVLSIERELEDVTSAITYVRSLERIDPSRIALWGASFGGGLTLQTAATSRAIACAITLVPFVDGPSMLGAVPPLNAARLTAKALADIAARRRGRERVMVPVAGPPGSVAAMTSPDALPGFEAITPPGSRHGDEVAAAITLEALRWRPGKLASSIRCPVLFQVATKDLDTPPDPAIRTSASAPRGELKTYDCGHFDVYLDPQFDRVVADQVEFLSRHLLGAGQPDGAGATA